MPGEVLPQYGDTFEIDGIEHVHSWDCDCGPTKCQQCLSAGREGWVHFQGIYGALAEICPVCDPSNGLLTVRSKIDKHEQSTPENSVSQPRVLTTEEVRDAFLASVRSYVDYWREMVQTGKTTPERAISGVAFCVLTILDGVTELPGFEVYPSPHPDGREYAIGEGENYYPDGPDLDGDIAGELHDHFYTEGWR